MTSKVDHVSPFGENKRLEIPCQWMMRAGIKTCINAVTEHSPTWKQRVISWSNRQTCAQPHLTKTRKWLWNSATKHKEAFSWHVCHTNGFEIELETCQIGTFAWGLLTTDSAHMMLSCIDQQALEPIFTYKMAIQYQKQLQCIFSQLVRHKQRLATVWQ